VTRLVARSVSGRLTAAFALLVGLLLVVGLSGVVGLVVAGRHQDREHRLERLEAANTEILLALTNAETGVRGYRLGRDRSFLEPYRTGRAAFPGHLREARAAARTEAERDLVRRQELIAQRWLTMYAGPVAAMAPGEVAVSPEMTLVNKEVFDELRATNGELDVLASSGSAQAMTDARRARAHALWATEGALAAALLVAVGAALRTRRALVAPLSGVVAVVRRLSAGEHSARAAVLCGPEEVRAVARSINALADESDRLRAERAERTRLQRLAVEVGRSIRDHLDAGNSVAEAVSRVGRGLGAERAYVRLVAEAGLGPVEGQWQAPGVPGLPSAGSHPFLRESSWLQQLHRDGELLEEPDVRTRALSEPAYAQVLSTTGAASILVVPIGAGEELLGALTISMVEGPRAWTPAEAALARSAAADLGRALVLARLYRQQEDLVEQLRELDRAKTDFLSAVSHELRTPLTSISGYLELIRDGDAGEVAPGVDAMLAVVERNTARLKTLIEDLLTLSRIESGTFRVSHADVEVTELVAAVVAALGPAAESGGVALEVRSAQPPVLVHGDAVQLERVLLNLVSNAVKFTLPGGLVQVRVVRSADEVVLEVTDTGIGIPEAEQSGLFSRFFRATNATDAAIPGTGLGLTIVRSIVEHHGGVLGVVSREGEGTAVTVRLPLLAATGPAAAPGPVAAGISAAR